VVWFVLVSSVVGGEADDGEWRAVVVVPVRSELEVR
jgi:hypothetical protein